MVVVIHYCDESVSLELVKVILDRQLDEVIVDVEKNDVVNKKQVEVEVLVMAEQAQKVPVHRLYVEWVGVLLPHTEIKEKIILR